jgi:tetratricopeptide (TPR) repeat protein
MRDLFKDPTYNRALDLIESGDFAGAERVSRFLLRDDPTSTYARMMLGIALSHQGKYWEAEPHLRLATQAMLGPATPHNELGFVYSQLDRPELALPHFQKAVQVNPRMVAYHFQLGCCLTALDRHEEAGGYLETASRMAPDNSSYLRALGRVYVRLGRLDSALEVRLRAHALAPEDHFTKKALASSYSLLGRFKEALDYNQQAIDLAPDVCGNYAHRAVILHKTGETAAAMNNYAVARDLTHGCSDGLVRELRTSWKLAGLLGNTDTQDFIAERLAAFVAPASEHAAPSI